MRYFLENNPMQSVHHKDFLTSSSPRKGFAASYSFLRLIPAWRKATSQESTATHTIAFCTICFLGWKIEHILSFSLLILNFSLLPCFCFYFFLSWLCFLFLLFFFSRLLLDRQHFGLKWNLTTILPEKKMF